MMKKLKKRIEEDISFELAEANRNYPLFASPHEGLAIIGEELEEARSEMRQVDVWFGNLIQNVYADEKESAEEDIEDIIRFATNLACEAVQVAAMGRKWQMGFERKTLKEMSMPELIAEKEKIEKEIRDR